MNEIETYHQLVAIDSVPAHRPPQSPYRPRDSDIQARLNVVGSRARGD